MRPAREFSCLLLIPSTVSWCSFRTTNEDEASAIYHPTLSDRRHFIAPRQKKTVSASSFSSRCSLKFVIYELCHKMWKGSYVVFLSAQSLLSKASNLKLNSTLLFIFPSPLTPKHSIKRKLLLLFLPSIFSFKIFWTLLAQMIWCSLSDSVMLEWRTNGYNKRSERKVHQ